MNSCFFFPQAGYVTSYNYFPMGARALDFGATDAEKPGSNRSRLNKMIKITPSSRFRAGAWSANAERCHEQYLAPTPRCSASVLAEHLRIYQNVELNGVQSVFFKLSSGVSLPPPQKKVFKTVLHSPLLSDLFLCVKLLSSSVSSWCLCLRGELFLTSAAFAARLSLFEIKKTH